MKIVHISDTHLQAKGLVLPDGDVLIHSGDHTGTGTRAQWERAMEWLGGYKNQFRHIIAISGNHDFITQKSERIAQLTCAREGIKYLCDSEYVIDGIKFYGSPWQPWFYDWAWNFEPFAPDGLGDAQAKKIWAKIPDDTNVLITHGPPKDILDRAFGSGHYDERTGCPYLRARIMELEHLQLHTFGHIHEQNGVVSYRSDIDGSKSTLLHFSNAAICDRAKYAPVQPYHDFEIEDNIRYDKVAA